MNEPSTQITADKIRGLFESPSSNQMPYNSDQPPPYSSLSMEQQQLPAEASMASKQEGPVFLNPISTVKNRDGCADTLSKMRALQSKK